jgi:intein-encoded DNA endonuclease-like protein
MSPSIPFTSEAARLNSRKFWNSSSPERIEERNRKLRRLPYHDPNIMAELDRLYRQGMNTSDIAKQFKVAKTTVLRAIHICNLQVNSPPPRYSPDLLPSYSLGYVLGVVRGDGYCFKQKNPWTHFVVGLNTIDKEFLTCFSFHLTHLLGRKPLKIRKIMPTVEWRQPYFAGLCSSNELGKFLKETGYNQIEEMMKSPQVRIGFLRGFFDSEGTICLRKHIIHKGQLSRRHPKRLDLRICNTEKELLEITKRALSSEGIETFNIVQMHMVNKWNVKPLYDLIIKANRTNHLRFATKIGTRITRKQIKLRIWKRDWFD